jgi:hypothetical protein
MDAPNFVNNELLCYLQNFFDKSPRDNIKAAVVGFYKVDEIVAAKSVLVEMIEKADIQDAPDIVQHRAGTGKRKADAEDILALYECLDNAMFDMPTFVAVKLNRIPNVSPSEVDVLALAVSVEDLRTQMAAMADAVNTLRDGQEELVEVSKQARLDIVPRQQATPYNGSGRNDGQAPDVGLHGFQPESESYLQIRQDDVNPEAVVPVRSWAQRAATLVESANDDGFQTVSYKRSSATLNKMNKLTGKKPASQSVKAVPRPLVCFVGRLDLDTTAADLKDYLADSGIIGADCTKLKAKDGRTFRTAAFRVSVAAEYRDLFYDANCWPESVELRDWYNRSTSN